MSASGGAKFAECRCTATEEDWELVDEKDLETCHVLTYRCRTCDEIETATVDVKQI